MYQPAQNTINYAVDSFTKLQLMRYEQVDTHLVTRTAGGYELSYRQNNWNHCTYTYSVDTHLHR